MDDVTLLIYVIMTLINSNWVMTARLNNGLSQELGIPRGHIDEIINPDSKITATIAIICGWGIWFIFIYYLFQGEFVLSAVVLGCNLVLPSFISSAVYHPKYFAKKALKNLYDEKKYQASRQKVPQEIELFYNIIEAKLKSIIAE